MGGTTSCCCLCKEVAGSASGRDQRISPEKLHNDNDSNNSQLELPSDYVYKDRTCTDVFYLVLKVLFVIVLIGLIAYCSAYADIYRIVNGYDDCGNVCGKNNEADSPVYACKGKDNTNNKYLFVTKNDNPANMDNPYVYRNCVQKCESIPGYKTFLNRCIRESQNEGVNTILTKTGLANFFQEVSEDLSIVWKELIYIFVIAFVFSIIIMVLFRYVVGLVVWILLIGVCLCSFFATIFLWLKWDELRRQNYTGNQAVERTKTYLAVAIIATIVTVCIWLVIVVMRKRIKLVIELFREAGKAISYMPLLPFEPFLTFIALAVAISIWLYLALIIESSGVLGSRGTGASMKISYIKDSTMVVTRWYNLFALFWITQFIIGCQHFIIAGAVATWFFTRNKNNLESPISRSFWNLIRYHLGSIALGSLLIASLQMIRALLKFLQYLVSNPENKVTTCLFNSCQCCLACFERFLQYLTRNAYIEVAMTGCNFCEGGQKAFALLTNNALRVLAINSVGDFVLLLGKVFVVLATVLIGTEMIQNKSGIHHTWVPITLGGMFAYLVSHCFLTVYEMTVDTIFLCFCEDCERNDGISRPYYMSRGLMEFVQNSKKTLNLHSSQSKKNMAWAKESVRSSGVYSISDKVSDS